MTNLTYSPKVLSHFRKPHNFGSMKNPDAVGEVGNRTCGDVMKLYIKVGFNKNKEEIIKDIKFETLGCAAAIATSSVVTDLAKNKTIEEALKINNQSVVDALDNLPVIKIHCSLLAADALAEAIYDYYQKNKKPIPDYLEKKHQQISSCHIH